MGKEKVLIVDDDESIRELLKLYLEDDFDVLEASNGVDALEFTKEASPDVILLDIMLPDKNGWDVCKEVRLFSNTPIIMISAKGQDVDKILGLELGADDYICKPFSPSEVLARVKAQIRRNKMIFQPVPAGTESLFGDLRINDRNYKVYVGNQQLELTAQEFDLLKLFTANQRRVFTRDQLLEKIWGLDYEGDTRAVDSAIKRLRKKIADYSEEEYIHTIRGVGYKFEVTSK